MQDKEINITVSVAEANGILQALGQMPYMQVADLIAKIKQQAEIQLNESKGE